MRDKNALNISLNNKTFNNNVNISDNQLFTENNTQNNENLLNIYKSNFSEEFKHPYDKITKQKIIVHIFLTRSLRRFLVNSATKRISILFYFTSWRTFLKNVSGCLMIIHLIIMLKAFLKINRKKIYLDQTADLIIRKRNCTKGKTKN